MKLNKILIRLTVFFLLIHGTETFAVDQVATPAQTNYILQPGPPPDTLFVPAGVTVVTTNGNPTVTLLGGNSITNLGSLNNNIATTIFAQSGSNGLMYLNNTGNLTAPIAAIDFSGVAQFGANIEQSGTINGQIILPTNSNSILNISGGTITNSIFKSLGTGVATINITGNFATSSTMNQIANINILAPATFTINNSITSFGILSNYSNVLVNNGSTLLSGNIINNYGNFQLNSGTIGVNNFINTGNLIIAGGTLSGTIVGEGQNSTITILNDFATRGNITNVQNIYVLSGTFTIQNAVTGYNSLNNQSTINLSGGTLSGGINPIGTNSTVNVNTNFTTSGIIGANNININPGATLTALNPLVATNAVNITPTATLILNNSISGNLINNGTFRPGVSPFISGNFSQTSNGTFVVNLGENQFSPYSNIIVGGQANVAGAIQVILPPDGGIEIANNNFFDIIRATGNGVFTSNPTIIQPDSFVLSFSLAQPNSQVLRLIARRTLFQDITTNPTLTGVAAALEQIRANRPTTAQRTLLSTLDNTNTLNEFETDLGQLLPITNGGIVYTALETQRINFDKIAHRLDSLRAGLDSFNTEGSYVAGDLLPGRSAVGPYFLVNAIKQQRQDGIDGFTSTSGGIGVLADTPVGCYVKVGGALSYIVSTVKVDHNLGNQTTINNAMGMVFGRFEYGWPFAEVMYALGYNQYRNRRNIAFLSQVATADYHGYQESGKIRAGVAIPIGILELTPQAWWQYTRLRIKQYGEKSAAGTALTVVGKIYTVLESAYGVRIAEISEPEIFYPEIHIMAVTFNKEPEFSLRSQFTDGGPLFVTPGPSVRRTGGNIGGSISALLSEGFELIGGYDYYTRKNYNSHALSLRLKYAF